jgi:hypothetical protein
MNMLIMTVSGLALLAALYLLNRAVGKPTHPTLWFVVLWAVASAVNFAIGVFAAGYSFVNEAAVHTVVFGVPFAVAWFLRSRDDP